MFYDTDRSVATKQISADMVRVSNSTFAGQLLCICILLLASCICICMYLYLDVWFVIGGRHADRPESKGTFVSQLCVCICIFILYFSYFDANLYLDVWCLSDWWARARAHLCLSWALSRGAAEVALRAGKHCRRAPCTTLGLYIGEQWVVKILWQIEWRRTRRWTIFFWSRACCRFRWLSFIGCQSIGCQSTADCQSNYCQSTDCQSIVCQSIDYQSFDNPLTIHGQAIVILDSDGDRLLAKYYDKARSDISYRSVLILFLYSPACSVWCFPVASCRFPNFKEQQKFEKRLHKKTAKKVSKL